MKRIIYQRGYFYGFSLLLVFVSIGALFFWGLHFGIDFSGGTTLEISLSKETPFSLDTFRENASELELPSLSVQTLQNGHILIQYGVIPEGRGELVLEMVQKQDAKAEIVDSKTVGGAISGEMRSRSIQAVVVAVAGIALYIAYAFRKITRPISSWLYGFGAIIALMHDIIITLGAFAFFGRWYGIEVDVPFIAALLTILGYSINDTIVVYDRIRENLARYGRKENFESLVNRSLNETLARSLNTSMTVIVVLLAIILFGGKSIFAFSLALLIGIFFGTYSSIFVASSLLVTMEKNKYFRFLAKMRSPRLS